MKIHDKILVKGHGKASVCDKRRLLSGSKTLMIKSTCWCDVIVSLMQLKAESRTEYAVGYLFFVSIHYLKQIQATDHQTVCVNTRCEFQDVLVRSAQAVSRPHEFVLYSNCSLHHCVDLWLHNTDNVVSTRHVDDEGESPHECRITKYSTWALT
jgi:hypothetical protein